MREIQITRTITNRETPSVEKYLNEISKISLIDAEEESRLARMIKAGDHAALEKLVNTNLRFVVSVAKKYQNQGLSLNDLISEGNLGLIRAARKFDETRGFKFISCAVWWIRQSMMEAIASQSRMIRLPNNQISALTKVNKAISRLEQKTERYPTYEELVEETELSAEKVADAIYFAPHTSSYDASFSGTDDQFSLLDLIANDEMPPDAELEQASTNEQLEGLLARLNERERQIIELSFGYRNDRALQAAEIAKIVRICPERVRQLRNAALSKLREDVKLSGYC